MEPIRSFDGIIDMLCMGQWKHWRKWRRESGRLLRDIAKSSFSSKASALASKDVIHTVLDGYLSWRNAAGISAPSSFNELAHRIQQNHPIFRSMTSMTDEMIISWRINRHMCVQRLSSPCSSAEGYKFYVPRLKPYHYQTPFLTLLRIRCMKTGAYHALLWCKIQNFPGCIVSRSVVFGIGPCYTIYEGLLASCLLQRRHSLIFTIDRLEDIPYASGDSIWPNLTLKLCTWRISGNVFNLPFLNWNSLNSDWRVVPNPL